MRLEHHLVGGYVRYISPYIIIIIEGHQRTLPEYNRIFMKPSNHNSIPKTYVNGPNDEILLSIHF